MAQNQDQFAATVQAIEAHVEAIQTLVNRLSRHDDMLATKQDLEGLEHRITHQLKHMAVNLDQVLADVSDESTVIDSVLTLLSGVQKQLQDALAGNPAQQDKIDAIFAGLEANKSKLAAAIAANTPVTPPTP